jgi:hypothetical protein
MALQPIRLEGFDLEAAVVRCREHAGLKHDALAALMGISSPQLSQQIARRGGYLSLPRLLSVATDVDGRIFLQLLWAEIAEYLGIEDRDAVALQLAAFRERFQLLLDKVQVRMLRVDLPAREKEKAS